MAGWHIDNETLYLTISHSFEGFSHLRVVPTVDKARPHVINVGHEVVLGFLFSTDLASFSQKLTHLLLQFRW